MDHLGDRLIGLDGVVAQQENYRKSGFRLAFRNVRQQGQGRRRRASAVLTELAAIPIEDILRYDETAFPAPRAAFLKSWIGQPQAVALGVVDGRRLKGYGVLRACREGFKIGPLFADDEETADRLFAGLIARAPGAPVFLDTPQANPGAVALAARYAMAPVFETARMVKNGAPQIGTRALLRSDDLRTRVTQARRARKRSPAPAPAWLLNSHDFDPAARADPAGHDPACQADDDRGEDRRPEPGDQEAREQARRPA